MQQKHQYEYAIVRVVPVVEREEFVNAGVILFCKKEKFIRMKSSLTEKKRADRLHLWIRPNAFDGSVRFVVHLYKPQCHILALAMTWKKHSIPCLMKW